MPENPALKSRPAELPAWLWLWLPPLMLATVYGAAIYDRRFHQRWFASEEGFLEWVTVLLLFPAIWYGIACWRRRREIPGKWAARWLLCMTLTSIYFAGEELSWGQKVFMWETPAFFMKANDQQETNLHNISSWFDQKPRLLFLLWVLVGGVVMPLRSRLGGHGYTRDDPRWWFWPTIVCVPSCALALALQLPEHIKDFFGLPPFHYEIRYAEVQEFYFSMFLLLYLASCYVRLTSFRDSR